MPCHVRSKDQENRFLRNNPLYEKINIHSILSNTSGICLVEVIEKPKQTLILDNNELIAMCSQPFTLLSFVKLDFNA